MVSPPATYFSAMPELKVACGISQQVVHTPKAAQMPDCLKIPMLGSDTMATLSLLSNIPCDDAAPTAGLTDSGLV